MIGSGQLSEEQKNIAPQAEATVTLANFPKVSATAGSDYTLTLSVTLKEDAIITDMKVMRLHLKNLILLTLRKKHSQRSVHLTWIK